MRAKRQGTAGPLTALLLFAGGCGGGPDSMGHPGPAPGPDADAQATLTWDPNSEDDLLGYRVYVGRASGLYDPIPVADVPRDVTSVEVGSLPAGRHFFAVTAYDLSGNESDYSNEVFKDLP